LLLGFESDPRRGQPDPEPRAIFRALVGDRKSPAKGWKTRYHQDNPSRFSFPALGDVRWDPDTGLRQPSDAWSREASEPS
jgi:hypothetical protein